MSDMYAIKGSTLTALGDVIRDKKVGEKISLTDNFTLGYRYGSHPNNKQFSLDGEKIKIRFNSILIDGNNGNLYPYAPNSGYNVGDIGIINYFVSNPTRSDISTTIKPGVELPYEVIADSNEITIYYTGGGSSKPVVIDVELIAVDENGEEYKYTPLEMVDAINGLDTELGDKFRARIQGNKEYAITAEDLEGITTINQHGFYSSGITDLELPNSITSIGPYAFSNCVKLKMDLVLPESITTLGSQSFYGCPLNSAKIMNKNKIIEINGSSISSELYTPFGGQTYNIYVPSNLYNNYLVDSKWQFSSYRIKPWGEYIFPINLNTYLSFNSTKSYSISLLEFETTPNVSITIDNESIVNVSNILVNEDNTLLTFDVNALNIEGSTTITVNVEGENTYTFDGTITVMEVLPQSTYEVVAVDGVTYGFTLNDTGYYESTNKGKGNSYAICQINISNLMGKKVYLDCINYAEANYDYGLLGAVNQTLGKNTTDDANVKHNFKGKSMATIQTIEYDDVIGDCFIQVKFKKDGSGDNNNDSIQFQVRFEE